MRYCKAYSIELMSAFPEWEKLAGGEGHVSAKVGFLWPDFTVTINPFQWNRMFLVANPSPEWETFCRLELGFSVPPEIAETGDPSHAEGSMKAYASGRRE